MNAFEEQSEEARQRDQRRSERRRRYLALDRQLDRGERQEDELLRGRNHLHRKQHRHRHDFGFLGTGDLASSNPQLGKLKDNGGETPTIELKQNSPAIDAGNDVLAPTTDQRGTARFDLLGTGTSVSDIGAYEIVFM